MGLVEVVRINNKWCLQELILAYTYPYFSQHFPPCSAGFPYVLCIIAKLGVI